LRSFGGKVGLNNELVPGSANQRGPLEWNALLSGSLVGNSDGENRQGTPFICPNSLKGWKWKCNQVRLELREVKNPLDHSIDLGWTHS
jgi:hypothetical protein